MTFLNASSNYLHELPDAIVRWLKLTTLLLSNNRINVLPSGIGTLGLVTLKLSSNRLETLAEDLVSPCLHLSLRQLWLNSNNLYQLPSTFAQIATLEDLNIAYNPTRSPPMDLVPEGTASLTEYIRQRGNRIEELLKRLCYLGFGAARRHVEPRVEDVVVGQADFLQPEVSRASTAVPIASSTTARFTTTATASRRR